jgi:UPF0176 protein
MMKILAYYHFTTVADPTDEVIQHHLFLKDRDVTCRIYLSEEGINGSLSAPEEDAVAYMDWMRSKPAFAGISFKIQDYHEHVFPKLTVKYRRQLVALDASPNMDLTAPHLSPKEWREMLEDEEEKLLIDVRNEYEWRVGHFEGAELPACETFREFNDYADKLKDRVDPKNTKVMMYCTGGIRCELYSSLLREQGFDQVYQLDGGVINYGAKEGGKHWNGKLFVFDDRLTTPISDEPTPVVGRCRYCGVPNETYYNCANVDCNDLFLCCEECVPKFIGCCKTSCMKAERVRPYQQQQPHKPFRRLVKNGSHRNTCREELKELDK